MTKGITLTKEQAKHFESIKWLYSNKMKDRASGRTTLVLLTLIDEAVTRLGQRVYLRNYGIKEGRGSSYTINQLHHLLDKVLDDRAYDYKFRTSDMSLIVDRYPLNSDLFRKDGSVIYYD